MSDLWTGFSRFPDQISDSSQGADAQARELAAFVKPFGHKPPQKQQGADAQARELAAFVEACDQKASP